MLERGRAVAGERRRQVRACAPARPRCVVGVRQKYRAKTDSAVMMRPNNGFSIRQPYHSRMGTFIEKYSSEVMILLLIAMVMATLLVLVPQLLRAHRKNQEEKHAERMQALERGMPLPSDETRARAAGRTAALV